MKRFITILLPLSVFGLLTACQGSENTLEDTNLVEENGVETIIEKDTAADDPNETDETKDETSPPDDEQAYMERELNKQYFREVEIDIEYDRDQEYSAEISFDDGRIEAEIEDEIKGESLKGKEAFDYIVERMSQIDITTTSDMNSVTKDILSLFDLSDNYKELDIEVTLQNGSKIEIEDKKH